MVVRGYWMLEAMDPSWVGLEVCLVSAFLFPVALCPVLFSVALGFLLILKKSRRNFCFLLGLLTLPSGASISLGEAILKSLELLPPLSLVMCL